MMHAEQIDDYDEIVRVLEMCMEGEAKGDAGLLKEAFHEDARMYGEVAGTRYDMPITDFFGRSRSQPTPGAIEVGCCRCFRLATPPTRWSPRRATGAACRSLTSSR
jgi:hypothetical protein